MLQKKASKCRQLKVALGCIDNRQVMEVYD